jgi:hypothetical protein
MASHLKRSLRPNEQVHHRNGVKAENQISNLELRLLGHGAGQSVRDRVRDLRRLGCEVVVPAKIKRVW